MHYFEDSQTREHNVTCDIAQTYLSTVLAALEIGGSVRPMFEVQKSIYGAKGDVDLLIYHELLTDGEFVLVGCEIKTSYLTSDGQLKSVKANKSKKQLINLQKDGFDYVWLLEFVVTEPANGWFHPQAGDALFTKPATVANPAFGHAQFQIGAVAGRPEADAGSIGWKVIQKAHMLPQSPNRTVLREAIRVKMDPPIHAQ